MALASPTASMRLYNNNNNNNNDIHVYANAYSAVIMTRVHSVHSMNAD